jgi:hypothetical protein
MQKVRAGGVTGCYIGYAPVLPDLINHIPAADKIASVNEGGASDVPKSYEQSPTAVRLLQFRPEITTNSSMPSLRGALAN